MPRRSSPRGRPTRKAKASNTTNFSSFGYTPPPVAFAAPTVPVEQLKTAYEWMVLDKTASFKLVAEWYSNNIAKFLFGAPLNETDQKTYERANKAMAQGFGTAYEHEKFQAWSTAIHLYEKLWAGKHNLPLLDPALAATPSAPVQNIMKVVDNLNSIFGSKGCKFRATFNDARELSEGEILIPYKDLDRMVAQQPFRVALDEIPTVCKVISLVTVDNNVSLDGAQFMANLPLLISHVGSWGLANREARIPIGKSAFAPVATGTRKSRTANLNAPSAPKAPGTPSQKIPNAQILHLTGAICQMKGKRAQVMGLLKDGMSLADFKAAVSKQFNTGPGLALAVLKAALDAKLVTL